MSETPELYSYRTSSSDFAESRDGLCLVSARHAAKDLPVKTGDPKSVTGKAAPAHPASSIGTGRNGVREDTVQEAGKRYKC